MLIPNLLQFQGVSQRKGIYNSLGRLGVDLSHGWHLRQLVLDVVFCREFSLTTHSSLIVSPGLEFSGVLVHSQIFETVVESAH